MNFKEKTLSSNLVYDGKILKLKVDKVLLPNGKESFREEVVHNGGVGILVVKDGKVLIVRQYRYAYDEVLIEIPAGKIEKGEDPLATAKRELKEEAGLIGLNFKQLTVLYPTPGYTNEKLYVYFCNDFENGTIDLDEDEFLEAEWIEFDALYKMVKDGVVKDAKTVYAVLSYACKIYEN